MDDHIARILKMLEEGKISAADAEKLLAALRPATPQAPPPPPPGASKTANAGSTGSTGTAGPRPAEKREEAREDSDAQRESSHAKSFEFSWSQKRAFPFDLSGLGRQISDAVRKIDPEKLMREARTGVAKGGKKWQDRMREWSRFVSGEEGPPENTLGQPTARATENLTFTVTPDADIHVENSYGNVEVAGSDAGTAVSVEIEKEAWAATDEEAQARLRDLTVEALTQQTPTLGASRLEVRVHAPEEWRDGWANLRLTVPEGVSLKLQTVYGAMRVSNTAGQVEAHTISGAITLENLRGEVRAEGISGEVQASHIGGPAHLASKSGDLRADHLSQGGEVTSVSGDVRLNSVDGAKLDARSVSGDVTVEDFGAVIAGDVTLESVSGDVSLNRAHTGSVRLKTISGDAAMEQLEVTTLQGETVSGDIRARLSAAFSGTLTANTVSGDVALRLPEASSFRFTLGTQSGELACRLPASDAVRTDTLHTGTVGAGAGTVTVQTRSGDVTVDKAE